MNERTLKDLLDVEARVPYLNDLDLVLQAALSDLRDEIPLVHKVGS